MCMFPDNLVALRSQCGLGCFCVVGLTVCHLQVVDMPIMVEATPSTLQVKLNGSRTHVMTNPYMWEGNKLSTSLMTIPPLSNVGQVSCI